MAGDLTVRGMRVIAGYVSANAGECQTTVLYSGPNLTPLAPHTPQMLDPAPVTVENIVQQFEDALDFALSLRDSEAAADALIGMAAVRGLAADRMEVAAAVADELRKLEK